MASTALELETTTSTRPQCVTPRDEDADPRIECARGIPIGEGRFAFHFDLPAGLGLTSVGIVDGQPEFRFGASPCTPAVMEADIAAALRLAYEGKRPEFFYIAIPPWHPFRGRQFKQYKPQWLRGTTFGSTFAEADWKMKSLHIGAQSNDSTSEFWAWEKTSKLEGLATRFDFREDKSPHGSVIMSCNSVTVQESETELRFVGEPKMRINDESNMRYSKYISKHFRSIAYHDEPVFLKMQELIKVVLAAEWLVGKGLKVDEDWMMNHTRPQAAVNNGVKAIEGRGGEAEVCRQPPREMIPEPANFVPPNRNVAVTTKEAKENRALAKKGVRRMYGWYDPGHNEGVMFDDEETLLQQQRSMKMVRKTTTFVDGKQTDEKHERLFMRLPFNIPIPPISEMGPYFTAFNPPEDVHIDTLCVLGHVSADISREAVVNDDCVELKRRRKFQLCDNTKAPTVEERMTVKISVDDFDTLYGHLDPNQPIWPEIPGKVEAVIPNVHTWSELYKETVPWPHTWKTPAFDMGQASASGGVSTRHIPVRREEARPRETVTETTWRDGYTRRGKELVVRGLEIARRAVFAILADKQFEAVAAKFRSAWQKGVAPTVRRILAVKNDKMERKWRAYRDSLANKEVEQHFHGTSLACNVSASQAPCQDGNCGVCGISCEGLDPQHIKKNIDFQRFGHGFYLAPHSSKCHDYTQGANGCRAMLLCDVCPGKKYKLEGNRQHLRGPPLGCDSVYGQVGSKLNYPEIVVYRSEAVVARYIIVYEKDGTQHPLSS